MKTLITIIAIALAAFTAKASELIPYIAMPVGVGYAIDAKGIRHPNAYCVRDAVFAPKPRYPYHNSGESLSRDPGTWTRGIQRNGLYRLDIDLNTDHVSRVTIIKSAGSKVLDSASTDTFKRWVFKPRSWKEIAIPTTVRTKWVSVINKAG